MLWRVLLAATMVASAVCSPAATPGITALAKTATCRRLCSEGLGGLRCGCDPDTVALGLQQNVHDWLKRHPDQQLIKGPRRHLCPHLCKLQLGRPLCRCPVEEEPVQEKGNGDLCHLCEVGAKDGALRTLLGCDEASGRCNALSNANSQANDTEVDWNLWCHIQCDQGTGGIACNCDMLPLSATGKRCPA